MKKILTSFILLHALFFAEPIELLKMKWHNFDSPLKENVFLLKVTNENDFWINNTKGNIYHYDEGAWIDYSLKTQNALSPTKFIVNDDDDIICFGVDEKWNTHFYKFHDHKWTKFEFVLHDPIINLININKTIYAAGAWGNFLKLEDGCWEKIVTPFENHINKIQKDSKNNIWLAVRSDGIYKFDGKSFTRFSFENGIRTDPKLIKISKDYVVQVLSYLDNVYILKDNVFRKSKKYDPKEWDTFSTSRFGFLETFVENQKGEKFRIKVPADYENKSFRFLKDSTIVSVSPHGIVYIGKYSETPYFVNLAKTYRVEGSPYSNSLGAAFVNFNNDFLPELFVFNPYEDDYSQFYLNIKNAPLADIAQSINLFTKNKSTNYIFGDFNKDNKVDFISATFDSLGAKFDVFTQTKEAKFDHTNEIRPTNGYNRKPLKNITATDFDNDGNLDIDATKYIGPKLGKGCQLLLKNNYWGNFSEFDTSYRNITSSYNTQSIHFDADGDNTNEWLILNNWAKNKLLKKENERWNNVIKTSFDNYERNDTQGAVVFDFNNDGAMDILMLSDTLFLQLYKNNGNGFFINTTNSTELNKIHSRYTSYVSKRNICTADFNNDGFTDIFLALKDPTTERNFLLINKNGKYFEDQSKQYGIEKPFVNGVAAGDIDNDGDLDLFAFVNGPNILWINTTDNYNYLKIKLQGIVSNTEAIGSKIWIYKSGFPHDKNHLVGYKQIGTGEFGKNQYNDLTAHFGVPHNSKYDVVCRFPSGEIKTVYNIEPGKAILIKEHGETFAAFYTLPAMIYRFIIQTETQFYLLLFLASILIIYFGVRLGIKYFNWNTKYAFNIVAIQLVILWIFILASMDSYSLFIKYIMPEIVLLIGIVLTHLFFFWNKKSITLKSGQYLQDNLLKLVTNFSHGEWALRNLNSLILLAKNPPENISDEKFQSQFDTRLKTFKDLTLPNIEEIIKLSSSLDFGPEIIEDITKTKKIVLKWFNDNLPTKSANDFTKFASQLDSIKSNLSLVRKKIYQDYSCIPGKIVKEIIKTFKEQLEENSIKLTYTKSYDGEKKVLIKPFEFADIIDNAINNAIKAVMNNEERKIEIKQFKSTPRIIIEITNTGKTIAKNKRQKIFEKGFSETGSTGHGLFSAREILKKYGGKIFVKASNKTDGTTFTIELNEGG